MYWPSAPSPSLVSIKIIFFPSALRIPPSSPLPALPPAGRGLLLEGLLVSAVGDGCGAILVLGFNTKYPPTATMAIMTTIKAIFAKPFCEFFIYLYNTLILAFYQPKHQVPVLIVLTVEL